MDYKMSEKVMMLGNEAIARGAYEAGVKVCLRAGDDADIAVKMIEMGLDYIPTNTMYRIDI